MALSACGAVLALLFMSASVAAAGGEDGVTGVALAGVQPVASTPPLAVKVLVINMFGLEATPWIAALHPARDIAVPGLPTEFPAVRCNADNVCQLTTGMGHANAAASMMAVLYSSQFDWRRTYLIVAGIGGIDPLRGTIGTTAWVRYVVDSGIAHEIDAREMPRGWQDGYFGVLTNSPSEVPKLEYGSEVFRLDEALLQRALELSRAVELEDSDDVRAYRAHYTRSAAAAPALSSADNSARPWPASSPPTVTQCDTLSADTWWAGHRLGEHARHWMRLLTEGKGIYCTTQQEDNATMTALTRAGRSGLVDLRRVAILRSGSDFDRPYAHQSTLDSMLAQRKLEGALRISTNNLVRTGMPLVEEIVKNWPQWQAGVPPAR